MCQSHGFEDDTFTCHVCPGNQACPGGDVNVDSLKFLTFRLQDFFYLRSAIRSGEAVGYMAMPDFSMCSALPDVETERKNAAAAAQPEREPMSMEDMYAALKNKFKGL